MILKNKVRKSAKPGVYELKVKSSLGKDSRKIEILGKKKLKFKIYCYLSRTKSYLKLKHEEGEGRVFGLWLGNGTKTFSILLNQTKILEFPSYKKVKFIY